MPYKDPVKRREAWNRHYQDNKVAQQVKIKERQKRYDKRNRQFVYDWLLEHPCQDCDESDPVVLEFDHLGDKNATICSMVINGTSLKRLEAEIAKCEVVCANCHRRRSASRGGYWRSGWLA